MFDSVPMKPVQPTHTDRSGTNISHSMHDSSVELPTADSITPAHVSTESLGFSSLEPLQRDLGEVTLSADGSVAPKRPRRHVKSTKHSDYVYY